MVTGCARMFNNLLAKFFVLFTVFGSASASAETGTYSRTTLNEPQTVFTSTPPTETSALTPYLNPGRVLYERPNASTQLELISCFTDGNCREDDKIRIYPMPCEGSGAADCTGCYALRGGSPSRIGDLNSAGNCQGVGQENEQKLRVFVGYERNCPDGTAVGAACTDGQLLLSCAVSTEGVAGVGDSLLSYNKDCFAGRAYVRKARGTSATVTVTPSNIPSTVPPCPAGTTGTAPSCTPCSDTSYKPTSGPAACTVCTTPTVPFSASVTYSTAGTTKTSVNDCQVATLTCQSGYTANAETDTCDPETCALGFSITGLNNPSTLYPTSGSVSGAASGAVGSVSFSISPATGTVTPSGSSVSVTGLSAGTYTLSASDNGATGCLRSQSVTLALATSGPSPTPTPTSTSTPTGLACSATTKYINTTAINLPAGVSGATYNFYSPSNLASVNCSFQESCREFRVCGTTAYSSQDSPPSAMTIARWVCMSGDWVLPNPPQGLCMCPCTPLIYPGCSTDAIDKLRAGMCKSGSSFCGLQGQTFQQGRGMVGIPTNNNRINSSCGSAPHGGGGYLPD